MAKFNKEFRYSNIGTVVGTLCHFKPLLRKDGSQYGGEYLINVHGHGAVNIRVPSMKNVNDINEEFQVSDRPHIRVGMVQVDTFFADSGKVYTNFTSFGEFKPVGVEVADTAKGNVSGEVVEIVPQAGGLVLKVEVYQVNKDGELVTNSMGKPFDPKVIKIDVLDEFIVNQVQRTVKVGSNVLVGYNFVNKLDISYDEYGLPEGSGERITRLEAGKLIVNANPKTEEEFEIIDEPMEDPFAGDPFVNDIGGLEITDDDLPF